MTFKRPIVFLIASTLFLTAYAPLATAQEVNRSGQAAEMSLYLLGKPTDISVTKAKAEQGDATAQYNLAVMYELGDGVFKNHEEALHWYKNAAEQGLANAQHNLALMYYHGKGTALNKQEAFSWFMRAANLGNSAAQYNVGMMYQLGDGVTANGYEAQQWYRKALSAGENNPHALYNLGLLYYTGEGVAKNNQEAFSWFSQAAELGHTKAQFNLGAMYEQGDIGNMPQPAQAINWYQQAAQADHANAQFNLGRLLLDETLVTKDPLAAQAWLEKAQAQGHAKATRLLQTLVLTSE